MTIKHGDDGRILVHCFGGCPTDAIVSSMGLSLADLFADSRQSRDLPPKVSRRKLTDQLDHELWILLMAIGDKTHRLDPRDSDRARVAARRITKALGVLYDR